MPMTDEEFERWRGRVLSAALTLICLVAIAREFFAKSEPNETVILAAFSFLGFPLVLAGVKGVGGGKKDGRE